jgi:DNA-binding transcriptional LysR family regulator
MTLMKTEYLTSFLVLAEELNFHRAAERLHISQPSLTRQMQELEQTCGTRLLHRNARSVSLTAAGEVLRQDAPPLLALFEQTISRAARQN